VRVNRRSVTAGVTGAVLTVLLSAGPALAEFDPLGRDDGGDPGEGLSALQTIGLYVLVPALIYGFITALVMLPGLIRGSRYRPNRGWSAPPVWFAGPPNPTDAVESAASEDVTRGGASGSW
jgi:hypothetical protein